MQLFQAVYYIPNLKCCVFVIGSQCGDRIYSVFNKHLVDREGLNNLLFLKDHCTIDSSTEKTKFIRTDDFLNSIKINAWRFTRKFTHSDYDSLELLTMNSSPDEDAKDDGSFKSDKFLSPIASTDRIEVFI